jgi:hypothetical protein
MLIVLMSFLKLKQNINIGACFIFMKMSVLYCMMETPEPRYEFGDGIDKVVLLKILGPDKKLGEIEAYFKDKYCQRSTSGKNQEEALKNVRVKANDAAEKASHLEGLLKMLRVEVKEYFVKRGIYKWPETFSKKPSDMITYTQISRKKEFRELMEAERKRANVVMDEVFSG